MANYQVIIRIVREGKLLGESVSAANFLPPIPNEGDEIALYDQRLSGCVEGVVLRRRFSYYPQQIAIEVTAEG